MLGETYAAVRVQNITRTSDSSTWGSPGCHAFLGLCGDQGAIDTLVKHFAAVLGERGIRVNAVAPGAVETDMSNFTKTDAGREFTLSIQALKRIAQPDDIGGVVAFLASDDARWISGDTIRSTAARSSEVFRRAPGAKSGEMGRLTRPIFNHLKSLIMSRPIEHYAK